MQRTISKPVDYVGLFIACLPVLLPFCWAWLASLMTADSPSVTAQQDTEAHRLAAAIAQLLLFVLPLLAAQLFLAGSHLAGCRLSLSKSGAGQQPAQQETSWLPQLRWLWWVLAMLCPLLLLWLWPPRWLLSTEPLLLWAQMAGLALLYQLQQVYQLRTGQMRRWWSLDGALVVVLLLWVVSCALLFTSHEPGLASQPIPVRLDWPRITGHPDLLLGYSWQLAVMAFVMFACYWINRYWLIRTVLAQRGLFPFILLSVGLMLLSYAPLAALLLQLPMNQPVSVPAVPAGNHNPFDWYNLNFMFLQWLFTTPLILAFERQQQDSTLAQVRQLQLQTELQLLQQQINPHFLFNTLNNLYALCLTKAESAPAMVLKLADLLRYVVYQGQQTQVTLQQELEYLQHYLALQQLRQAQPLQLTLQLPADAGHYSLPPLLLIMLLENAFKHGIEPDSKAAVLQIMIKIRQQRLELDMLNSLPATASAEAVDGHQSAGMGLANLQRRLRLLFGSNFQLQSAFEPQTGYWRASLQLPLQPVGGELS